MSLGYSTKDNASNIPALRFKNGLLSFLRGFNTLCNDLQIPSITCSNGCHVSNHGWHRWKPSLVWPCATFFTSKPSAGRLPRAKLSMLLDPRVRPSQAQCWPEFMASWLCRAAGPVQAISQKIVRRPGVERSGKLSISSTGIPTCFNYRQRPGMELDAIGCRASFRESLGPQPMEVIAVWCQTQMLHGFF